jgi:hypothetical protein
VDEAVAEIRKAADPGSGSAAWRLPSVGDQQVGGLQALVPGKDSSVAPRPMTPPVWRMRAHVDTWTPAAVGARARISKEAGPYADMPKDGV